MFYLISTFLCLFPFLIVGFWKKRPIIALILATMLAYLMLIISGLIQTFQAMMNYGTGDPQLIAGGISQTLVSSTLTMFIIFPLLLIFQVFMRRHREKQAKHEAVISGFE